jgi:hypothetical protein
MFASLFISPQLSSRVSRTHTVILRLAFGLTAAAGITQAAAAPLCKPVLAFQQVGFSPINYETMRRQWAATLSVDGTPCATASGRYEISFVLWSETAQDDEFIRAFAWAPGLTAVTVDVAAHEAIGGYLLQNIATCPCRQQGAAE